MRCFIRRGCAATARFLVVMTVAAGSLAIAQSAGADVAGIPRTSGGFAAPHAQAHLPPLRIPLRPARETAVRNKGTLPALGPLMATGQPVGEKLSIGRALTTASTAQPVVGATPTGVGSGQVNLGDVQLGVGPTDVLEMTNGGVEFWSKQGQVEGQTNLGASFSSTSLDRRCCRALSISRRTSAPE